MKKKLFAILLLLPFVFILATPSRALYFSHYFSVLSKDSASFNIKFVTDKGSSESTIINFNNELLASMDYNIENREIAQVMAAFANAAYNGITRDTYILREDGSLYNSVSGVNSFMDGLGFADVAFCDFSSNKTQGDISLPQINDDTDDTSAFMIGHKKVEIDGSETIVISVRGSISIFGEWASNYDIGADVPEYYQYEMVDENNLDQVVTKYRTHSDWVYKEHHKGFDVAANRVMKVVDEYVLKHIDADASMNVFVTGHSRGAGIANLIGAKYIGNDPLFQKARCQTYTFGSPNTVDTASAQTDAAVFNYCNANDVICMLPPAQAGFTKYGQLITCDVDNTILEEVNALGQFNYHCNNQVDSLILQFLNVFQDRATTYNGFGRCDSAYTVYDWSELSAVKNIKDLNELGFAPYVKVQVEQATNPLGGKGANVHVLQSPAFLLRYLAFLISAKDLQDEINRITQYNILENKGGYATLENTFILALVEGMVDPHNPITYMAIAKYSKYF
ncbi:MAG: hypothetical protein HUJ51_00090 [Eggerthellaceae bacterium]|nr:hypothetical protein [Eggerthellaceae bacterium]